MPYTPVFLKNGAYTATALMASAQRCLNLYGEKNPDTSVFPMTYYPTPGLVPLGTSPKVGQVRGLYTAGNGELFAVIGNSVYFVDSGWNYQFLGNVANLSSKVGMSDNKQTLVIVDGSPAGLYTVDLASKVFAQVVDPAFYPSTHVDYTDGFLIFNYKGTRQWFVSLLNTVTPLDPLYFASKEARTDLLSGVFVNHREVWLIGQRTSECWFNAGGAQFPFQIQAGVFVEHGTPAPYSIAGNDLAIFMLSQDREGTALVLLIVGYAAKRISTHAIENELRRYTRLDDAIGMAYQQNGHVFYMLTFPTQDKTWVYDLTTGEWHERAWIDSEGQEHRHRANAIANAYGKVVVGDWENGKLYSMDLDVYTDDGSPVSRIIGFPHIMVNNQRFDYIGFMANIEAGTTPEGTPPTITLRWSDTRGKSWGTPLTTSVGEQGEYGVVATWTGGLGQSRDRVFELSWSLPSKVAVGGAWIDGQPLRT